MDLRYSLPPAKATIDTVAAKNLFIISPSLQRVCITTNLELVVLTSSSTESGLMIKGTAQAGYRVDPNQRENVAEPHAQAGREVHQSRRSFSSRLYSIW
jgi:hypothetical protein